MIALYAPPAELPPPSTVAELNTFLSTKFVEASGPGALRFTLSQEGRQTAVMERRAGPTMVTLVMADGEGNAELVVESGPNRTRCIEVVNNRCWVKEHVNPMSVFERSKPTATAENSKDNGDTKFNLDNSGPMIALPPKATIARVTDGKDIRIVTLGADAYADEEPGTVRLTFSRTTFWPFTMYRTKDGKVDSMIAWYDPTKKSDNEATIEDEVWSRWLPALVPAPSEEGGGGLASRKSSRALFDRSGKSAKL